MKFNWNHLNNYKLKTPFFLSGGIGPNDVIKIKGLGHPQFYGIDINSKFERSPGLKNVPLIEKFIQELNVE